MLIRDIEILVLEELKRAMEKFPEWPIDPLHAQAIVSEEHGEFVQSVLQWVYDDRKGPELVKKEAIQTIAMLYQFLMLMDDYHPIPAKQVKK